MKLFRKLRPFFMAMGVIALLMFILAMPEEYVGFDGSIHQDPDPPAWFTGPDVLFLFLGGLAGMDYLFSFGNDSRKENE